MGVFKGAFSKSAKADRQLADEIEILRKSPLLDPVWYRETYVDFRDAPIDAARHYLKHGAREGRNPHPLFDTKFYLDRNPDVRSSGANPLIHYILHGAKERRTPHPLFDPNYYLQQVTETLQSEITNPLAHYLVEGWKMGLRPSGEFDPHWYLAAYPDVRASGIEPLSHYAQTGRQENRRPHPDLAPSQRTHDKFADSLECQKTSRVKGPVAVSSSSEVDSVYAPISVIVPTYNRGSRLVECLRACARNSGGVEIELVVVDDGSSDNTPSLLQSVKYELPALVWTSIPNGGPGQARNIGAEMAKHDIILFIGDDIHPLNDDFFRVHSRIHGKHQSDRFAVLGKSTWPTRADYNVNFVMTHIQGRGGQQFGYADLPPYTWIDWRFFYTSNISVKKSLVGDWLLDGFSAAFAAAAFEDIEFAYCRTKEPGGFRIFYDPGSAGEHLHVHTTDTFIRRQVSAGRMACVAIERHAELLELFGLNKLAEAIDSLPSGNSEANLCDYMAALEGVKAFGRLLEARKALGREAWHTDLLFAIFEVSFFQGFLQAYAKSTSNFSAGYSYILSSAFQRLHRVIHTEITAHEYFTKDLWRVLK